MPTKKLCKCPVSPVDTGSTCSIQELMEHSVVLEESYVRKCVSKSAPDHLSEQLQSLENTQVYSALESIDEESERVVYKILLGCIATVSMRLRRESVRECTLIADDGTHQCDACALRPVQCTVYFFERGRAHACVPGCGASSHFHRGSTRDMSNLVYICDTSGKPHICTPELCDALKFEQEGQLTCALTGNCVGASRLSNGWIDDPWRYKPSHAKKKQKTSGGTLLMRERQNMQLLYKIPSPEVCTFGQRHNLYRTRRIPTATTRITNG